MTKEEKKDEMKNRISMALKDPILQQGFEIICKNLTELERENNNLLDVINNQDVKIADLEKQIEKLLDWISENGYCCDFCPLTDTCRNDEGTCHYVIELQKDETKITKEWAKQKLLKEIEEND